MEVDVEIIVNVRDAKTGALINNAAMPIYDDDLENDHEISMILGHIKDTIAIAQE